MRLTKNREWFVSGLVAGFVASTVAIIVMLALRFLLGTPTVPELLAERTLPYVPATLVVRLLVTFGKIPPLGMTLLGQWAFGALLGILFVVVLRRSRGKADSESAATTRRVAMVAIGLAVIMWLVSVAIFWPVLPENLYGYPAPQGRLITFLTFGLVFASYGTVLAVAYRLLTRSRPVQSPSSSQGVQEPTPSSAIPIARRTLLTRSALTAGGTLVVGGGAVGGLLTYLLSRSASYDGHRNVPGPRGLSAITPNGDFYVVTKNVVDPAPSLERWALDVNGLVGSSGQYDLASLQRLPQEARTITLECISNEVSGDLISTAVWRGVPLEAVLRDRGGVKSPGNRVIFHSADGFTSTLPLQDLLQHRALLAWEMNGVALPIRHGFPLRVIVPGYYGEKSAKWIVGIEVVNTAFKDFYEGEGWSGQPLKTRSRIDLPKPGAVICGPVTVEGIAFAGTRGIRTVEVSTDGGKTWNKAALKPRLSSESWVFWTWRWAHPGIGSHDLSVRAVDGTGASQIAKVEGTVPSGASGYHHVPVRVA